MDMRFVVDDGGRKAAGFQGRAGDCVCRAIAIASGKPYREVYDALNALAKVETTSKRRRSSAREGVHRVTYSAYLASLGFTWTPTMLVKEVQAFAAKHGLSLEFGGAQYDASGAEWIAKLRFRTSAADQQLWGQYCGQVGLKPEDLGREFKHGSASYRICGINPRSGTKPIIGARVPDGQRFIFEDRAIRKHFGCEFDWEKEKAS